MHVTVQQIDDLVELQLEGMLDNESAVYLRDAVDEAVRSGWHKIIVNLQGVSFVSSAGIGVLLRCHKQLHAIRGFFATCDPSPQVEHVLRMTKTAEMLICDRANIRSAAVSGIMTRRAMSRIASQAGINFEIYAVDREASLRCHVLGSAKGLFDSGFTSEQCRRVPFPQSSFGLGLGAFGADFKECQPRFGEFLAVQGAAAQLPTHSFGVPDYILASERLVPEVEVLYGMKCEGEFARCCRFLPTEQTETVKFCNLVEQCLSLGETQLAGFVMIAECAGLVGASLRRSPAVRTSAVGSRFQYPEIRDWISFSSDQVHRHSIAVVVGIATKERPRDGASALAPFLRPLGDGDNVLGHFHAAVFPYRPLKKRSLDLHDSVMTLFDSGTLQGVVHLLNDRRPVSGAGESEFLGGGCWIAPIGEVVAESNAA